MAFLSFGKKKGPSFGDYIRDAETSLWEGKNDLKKVGSERGYEGPTNLRWAGANYDQAAATLEMAAKLATTPKEKARYEKVKAKAVELAGKIATRAQEVATYRLESTGNSIRYFGEASSILDKQEAEKAANRHLKHGRPITEQPPEKKAISEKTLQGLAYTATKIDTEYAADVVKAAEGAIRDSGKESDFSEVRGRIKTLKEELEKKAA